jgi:integrase
MPRISFTTFALKSIPNPAPRNDGAVVQVDYYDETTSGFCLRASSSGNRTWSFMARVEGTGVRFTIGRAALNSNAPGLGVAEARAKARELRDLIDRGLDPREVAAAAADDKAARKRNTFKQVSDAYIEEYAKPETKTWKETQRIVSSYLLPRWGSKAVSTIQRKDVVSMIAEVKENHGQTTAGHALSKARAIFNWHMGADEKFVSPVVRRHSQMIGKRTKRDRVLEDWEIQILMPSLNNESICPVFRDGVRVLLFTVQRRGEVFKMQWPHLQPDDAGGAIWTIPAELYKAGREHVVYLTPAVFDIVSRQKRRKNCDWVFTTNGRSPFSGYSKSKAELDAAIAARGVRLAQWGLHDLRRTGRSLMSRLHVPSETAERVIGHVIPGVEGIYDRYSYVPEKKFALTTLSEEILAIERSEQRQQNIVELSLRTA